MTSAGGGHAPCGGRITLAAQSASSNTPLGLRSAGAGWPFQVLMVSVDVESLIVFCVAAGRRLLTAPGRRERATDRPQVTVPSEGPDARARLQLPARAAGL